MVSMKVEKSMSNAEVKRVLESDASKSAKMKTLFLGGVDVKTISGLMNTRYNFVYNVVSNMIRVEGMEDSVVKVEKDNRKDDIIRLLNEGKSNVEISRELKCNYNYVWKIVNEHLRDKK